MRTHEWIEERSLALHEAIAAKLEADPRLLSVATANLARWLQRAPSPALAEWQRILQITPLPDLLVLLRARTEGAARLRQSSPFPGVLSPAERNRILHAYESRRA